VESESLDQLKASFVSWRKSKQSRGESIPADLLERAKAAAVKFGVNAVRRTLNIDRRLIEDKPLKRGRGRPRLTEPKPTRRRTIQPGIVDTLPAYSRLEMSAPGVLAAHPIAELEMVDGSKLRIFTMNSEAVTLLTSLCSGGGTR
jgi:hypothetical protein